MRGGQVRRFRAFAFLFSAFIFALLPTFASAQIVHEETLIADSVNLFVSTQQVANVGSGTDQLNLATVSYYGNGSTVTVDTVTGGGLTWTLAKKQCSERLNRMYLEIWQAYGSPGATFNVDVNLINGTAVTTVAVSRYSGADSTTPTEGAAGSNTGGQEGACPGSGVDDVNASLSLTSSQNDSVLFAATHPRNTSITTPDAAYTQRAVNTTNADGGSGAFLYVHDRSLAAAGADSVDHTLNATKSWIMAGLVINPASAGSCLIDVSIIASSDDAEEPVGGGTVDLASSDLELINDGSDQEVGLRFQNLAIAQGATITNAYVTFYTKNTGSAATSLTFYANDVASAATFSNTSPNKIVERAKTTASVAWNNVPAWNIEEEAHNSPDISSVIQEVVNRGDWASGNDLAIIVTGTASSLRRAWSWDGIGVAASLHVECSGGGGGSNAVTSAIAEISPTNVTTSSTGNSFTYDIQATIGGGDTGVDRVTITVPGTFGAPTVTDVQDDGVSVAYTDNTVGNAISVDLTTKITATSKITVLFNSDAPTTQDLTGVDFTSTVDDSGTGDAAQATTEGDGDGEPGDANSWTVTTTDAAGGGSGGGACPAPGAGGWYPGGWLYRKPLSIGSGNVGSNLTDFPVLVSLASDTDLAADAQGDFDDILFTAADGTTKLSHEIEKYNETTGELVAWVKVPTVSSSADTVFYMYYGNATAGNQQDPTGVWSNGYAGVWHLKEDPSGTAPQMNDSTSNALHATSVGSMTSGNQIGGKIDGALDFDGSDDYLQSSDYDITGAITVSAWVNWDAISASNEGIISKRTDDENAGNWTLRFNSGLYEWMLWSGIDSSDKLYSVSAPTAGQWEYVVLTFDDPTNTAKIYLDGGLDNSSTSMTKSLADTPEIIKFAQHGQGATTLNGKLDEVRLASAVRSADWIS
ncbi:MAG TPA: DUF2341 domain-containing protein, partial [Woeseiaceae bacterium]|nr:DUF2341 domain-containing protein [Woeseiaceae bacterium]